MRSLILALCLVAGAASAGPRSGSRRALDFCPPNSSPDPTTVSGCSCDVGYAEQPDGTCVAATGCSTGMGGIGLLAFAAAAVTTLAVRRRAA